jgi:hypothetical protein
LRKEDVLYVVRRKILYIRILLKCSSTRKWREQFLSRKCLGLNEWIVFKKIINCTISIKLRNIGELPI